jgi:hypothetical protein
MRPVPSGSAPTVLSGGPAVRDAGPRSGREGGGGPVDRWSMTVGARSRPAPCPLSRPARGLAEERRGTGAWTMSPAGEISSCTLMIRGFATRDARSRSSRAMSRPHLASLRSAADRTCPSGGCLSARAVLWTEPAVFCTDVRVGAPPGRPPRAGRSRTDFLDPPLVRTDRTTRRCRGAGVSQGPVPGRRGVDTPGGRPVAAPAGHQHPTSGPVPPPHTHRKEAR